MLQLNIRAEVNFDALADRHITHRVSVYRDGNVTLVDCGAKISGSLSAGITLAKICMSDLAEVQIVAEAHRLVVQVQCDHPVAACLASQYAGWQISVGKYFAMGSGPMRAAYGKEKIFEEMPHLREGATTVVGVLETRKAPTEEAIAHLREKLPKGVQELKLAFAPTASLAGTIQVVARSLETALHKLHELKFDLSTIISGHGVAPLPPIGKDDMQAIGWTNDAILYGGRVTLWVDAEDDLLNEIGPKVPSNASADFGRPFGEIFKAYEMDFYKIDPQLFSPAEITFVNLRSGRMFRFGKVEPEIMRKSFA